MSLVFIMLGFLVFLAASALAIDVGLFMTARAQAQNAADGGALAGAVALVFDSYTDRSSTGPVVQSAISTATKNVVIDETVSVQPSDVTFPTAPSGDASRVKVNVFRTTARTNPLATLIGPLLGVSTADISATATAEAARANAMRCVKPFTIPDRWVEVNHPAWTTSSTYQRYYESGSKKGQVLPSADYYPTVDDDEYNGYDMENPDDIGLQLTLRAGNGNQIEPSAYFSWAMPGGTGGSWYEGNIEGCNTTLVHFDDPIEQEPGAMNGPTSTGIEALIQQDPYAYWDTDHKRVVSTKNPSPRVVPIPLFDPEYYQSGKVSGRVATLKVANWIGFFVTGHSGNEVYGRITPILGVYDDNAGPAPDGAFPRYIRLVE